MSSVLRRMNVLYCILLVALVSADPGARISFSERGIEAIRSAANGFIYERFMELKSIPDSDFGIIKAANVALKPYSAPEIKNITIKDGEKGNGSLVLSIKGGLLTGTAEFVVGDFKFLGVDMKSAGQTTIGIREINGEVHLKGFSYEGRPVFRATHCDILPEFKIKSISGGKVAKVADRFKGTISGMVSKQLGTSICNQVISSINNLNSATFKYPTMARLEDTADSRIINYGLMPEGFQIWSGADHRPVEINMYGTYLTSKGKPIPSDYKLSSPWTPKDDKMFYIELADAILKPFVDRALKAFQIKTVLWGDTVMGLVAPATVTSVGKDSGNGYLKVTATGEVKYDETTDDQLASEIVEINLRAFVNEQTELQFEAVDLILPTDMLAESEREQMKGDVNEYFKKSSLKLPMAGIKLDKTEVKFFDKVIRIESDTYKN